MNAAARAVVGTVFIVVALSACTPTGTPTARSVPSTQVSATASSCPSQAVGLVLIGRYRTLDGGCVPARRVLAVRCAVERTPIVVQRLGRQRSLVHLGGRFAVPARALPPDAVEIGVSASERLLVAEGQLYVEASGSVTRWLAIRPSHRVVREAPDVWMIGDSILDGARDLLPVALPRWRMTLDAEVGRTSSGGLFPLAQAAASAPEVVVVELGTNDEDPSVFRANADTMLTALAPIPLVLWIVPHGPATQMPAISRELREAVALHPNAAVADWDAFVPEEALADGVHLLPDQQDVFTEFLTPYLSEWLSVVRGRGPVGCLRTVSAAFERP